MPLEALTSAEISLPPRPDALRVRERIAALADSVDLVALTDNNAGEARMSPLAAVALAREQGVRTVVHISCRDRNRLALQSQVVGAAALGAEGVLCVQGDPVDDVPRVGDLTATRLIRRVKDWAAPQPIAVGAVVNPFADDVGREIALLERKLAAGAEFVQSQMTFDVAALTTFLDRVAVCSTTFASTPGSDCCATSGWPTEPANYPAACCPTRPTAGSCSATASGSRKNWRASSRASKRSMRCTSTRSAPNRRHATSQPLSEPSAARRRTATEHRALAEARHGGTAAACECPGDPAPGLAPFVRSGNEPLTAAARRLR